jgi:hypothetical protein
VPAPRANFRGNALISLLSEVCPSLLIMILCHFLQNTVPSPRARTILTMLQAQSLPRDLIQNFGSTDVQIRHIRPNSSQFSFW